MATIDASTQAPTPHLVCGLIMPISSIDGLGADHWTEVKSIIQDAVDSIPAPKFSAKLVSDADDVGVIHKRIVQGVYNSDVVVCDVSARNPNVMFELGMRLAFDKPTVIIKDDKTDYAFDTSIIEHIPYPRDLRFSRIVAFKRQLAEKVLATYRAATDSSGHSTFLKNFGTFKVAELNQTIGSGEQVMMEMLTDIQQEVTRLRRTSMRPSMRVRNSEEGRARIIAELLKMRSENPDTSLEPSEELAKHLEKLLPAPDYFSHKTEFRDTLAEVCASLDSK
jgi:hypothetical protein